MEKFTTEEVKAAAKWCLNKKECAGCPFLNKVGSCQEAFAKAYLELLEDESPFGTGKLRSDNKQLTTENAILKKEFEDTKERVNSLNSTISELRQENYDLAAENKQMDDKISEQFKAIKSLSSSLKKENLQNMIYMELIHQSGNRNLLSIMENIVKLGGLSFD